MSTGTDEILWQMHGSSSSHIIGYVFGVIAGSYFPKLGALKKPLLSKAQTRVCAFGALLIWLLLGEWCHQEWYHSGGALRSEAPLRTALIIVVTQLLQVLLWTVLCIICSPITPPNAMKKLSASPLLCFLARLNVSTYAAHLYPIVLMYYSARAPVLPSLMSDVYEGIGHQITAFFLGFVLFMSLQFPLNTLQDMLYQSVAALATTPTPHIAGNNTVVASGAPASGAIADGSPGSESEPDVSTGMRSEVLRKLHSE